MGYLQDIKEVMEDIRDAPIQNSDYFLDVARGKYPGIETAIIRGHNPSQTSASGSVDVAPDGDLTYLTAAETMNIVSTDANDTLAGTGLQTLLIQGIDKTAEEIQEVVKMNGTSNVLTKLAYSRVNFIIGIKAGSVGWNIGVITAIASSAATIQAKMHATRGLNHNSNYTVAHHHEFYAVKLELNVAKAGGNNPVVEFQILARPGGPPNSWITLFIKTIDSSVSNHLDVAIPFPAKLIGATDLRLRTNTDANNTSVRTRVYGLVVDVEEAAALN